MAFSRVHPITIILFQCNAPFVNKYYRRGDISKRSGPNKDTNTENVIKRVIRNTNPVYIAELLSCIY